MNLFEHLHSEKLWKDSSWDCVQLSLRSPVASRQTLLQSQEAVLPQAGATSKHVHAGDCLAIVFHQKTAFFGNFGPHVVRDLVVQVMPAFGLEILKSV